MTTCYSNTNAPRQDPGCELSFLLKMVVMRKEVVVMMVVSMLGVIVMMMVRMLGRMILKVMKIVMVVVMVGG